MTGASNFISGGMSPATALSTGPNALASGKIPSLIRFVMTGIKAVTAFARTVPSTVMTGAIAVSSRPNTGANLLTAGINAPPILIISDSASALSWSNWNARSFCTLANPVTE